MPVTAHRVEHPALVGVAQGRLRTGWNGGPRGLGHHRPLSPVNVNRTVILISVHRSKTGVGGPAAPPACSQRTLPASAISPLAAATWAGEAATKCSSRVTTVGTVALPSLRDSTKARASRSSQMLVHMARSASGPSPRSSMPQNGHPGRQ
ncbi:hypothetical protein H488_0105940 [Kocuria sp. UCD-OTCP]|nr:hypothetical protein H488_0105940 [Kocuria sp. UCD-OTCP]